MQLFTLILPHIWFFVFRVGIMNSFALRLRNICAPAALREAMFLLYLLSFHVGRLSMHVPMKDLHEPSRSSIGFKAAQHDTIFSFRNIAC